MIRGMHYLGGKGKFGKEIASEIERLRDPTRPIFDAFCGALSVIEWLRDRRVANDACGPLICLYRAMTRGWEPPDRVTEDDYRRVLAEQDAADPLLAFVAVGCSYGGKWGAGYARSRGKRMPGGWQYPDGVSFASIAKRSLSKKIERCRGVAFTSADYREIEARPGDTVYCDPPHAGTTEYAYCPGFSTEEFWAVARSWARSGIKVLVSESQAPPEWVPVRSWSKARRLGSPDRSLSGERQESLYSFRG